MKPLRASEVAIAEFLLRAWARGGVVQGCKPGVIPSPGYVITHASHRRGSSLLTLKLAAQMVDWQTPYGIWDQPRL